MIPDDSSSPLFRYGERVAAQVTYILGLSAFYHDSAACILRDGEILAAAQEERFTRKKGDASFPEHAIDYCLREAGITAQDLSYVGFYDKPLLKFERILETYVGVAPRGFVSFMKAAPLWVKEKLYMEKQIRKGLGYEGQLLYAEHHESHAASAFYPSPFEEAAILTMDGVGEWATASFGIGRGNDVELYRELRWPDSLGLLYSAFTYYTGFKVNSGEYKVMGLAPYGEPKYVQLILDELVDLREDGSFTLNQKYFNYLTGLTMTNGAFNNLFGGPPRVPESKLTQREMDLARSVQEVCEEIMLRMSRAVHAETGLKNLCLAGGVALNCVGNGRILREGPFENIWIQPAAGDAGGALGIGPPPMARTP
jgi:carbamoyltransferase